MKNEEVARLFEGWEETMIYSCLEGRMGKIVSDGNVSPSSAFAVLGCFCFLAGHPSAELVRTAAESSACVLVPQNEEWLRLAEETLGKRVKKAVRYAVKKERDVFDREKLKEFVARLPRKYELRRIDGALYERVRALDWSRDFCSQFPTYEKYRTDGLGVVALREGIPVSGASSYSVWSGGIEIEIDTRSDCRRKGLATACGAALILECLKKSLYPSWDAHDLRSLALAEKLGYHGGGAYPVLIKEEAL